MRVLYLFFSIKFRKFWHTARLSRTNRHKVIKCENNPFFGPPCTITYLLTLRGSANSLCCHSRYSTRRAVVMSHQVDTSRMPPILSVTFLTSATHVASLLPARRHVSAATSYDPVFVRLSVCLSQVGSSVETDERIKLVIDTGASFHPSYTVTALKDNFGIFKNIVLKSGTLS